MNPSTKILLDQLRVFAILAVWFVAVPETMLAQTTDPIQSKAEILAQLEELDSPKLEPSLPQSPPERLLKREDQANQADSVVSSNRISKINNRINLLNKLMREEKEAAMRKETQMRIKAPVATPSEASPNTEDETKPDFPETPETKIAEPSESFTPTLPVDKTGHNQGGTLVVAEPVNTFELGNSLFRTGNFAASIKSYQATLDQGAENEESTWLNVMLGCCFRLSGDYANAESSFRSVTSAKLDPYARDYAKWNLDYIGRRRESQAEFQAIEAEIDAIVAEIKTNE